MNRTIITGRWIRDPELGYTANGTPVAIGAIAVDDGYGDNQKTYYFDVVMWKKTAENVVNFSKKGDMVGIDGRLTSRSYENQEGRKIKVVELVANEVEFLETNSGGNQTSGGGSHNDYGYHH